MQGGKAKLGDKLVPLEKKIHSANQKLCQNRADTKGVRHNAKDTKWTLLATKNSRSMSPWVKKRVACLVWQKPKLDNAKISNSCFWTETKG